MPRRVPREGDDATVVYLAAEEHATIEHVQDGGRRVVVVTEEGQVMTFALGATGRFQTADHNARLRLG